MRRTSYLANRAPHCALRMQCPHKMLQGRKPDRRHPRVIGAKVFVNTNESTQKLSPEAVGGRLVSYGGKSSKCYRVY
ncbi:unnamed protein product, partial [Sphacelaria rigidula]